MNKWLIKSEPATWSWSDQLIKKITHWDGVRNYQAASHLRKMKVGDLAFFYHSGDARQIVGIVKITKEAYPDPTDSTGRFVMVDVEAYETLIAPVTLASIKSRPDLASMPLVKQSRLSVMPVREQEWEAIMSMAFEKR